MECYSCITEKKAFHKVVQGAELSQFYTIGYTIS